MLKVGDVVVTMSYPGLFTIVEIADDHVKIADADGSIRVVQTANVRNVRRGDAPAR